VVIAVVVGCWLLLSFVCVDSCCCCCCLLWTVVIVCVVVCCCRCVVLVCMFWYASSLDEPQEIVWIKSTSPRGVVKQEYFFKVLVFFAHFQQQQATTMDSLLERV